MAAGVLILLGLCFLDSAQLIIPDTKNTTQSWPDDNLNSKKIVVFTFSKLSQSQWLKQRNGCK